MPEIDDNANLDDAINGWLGERVPERLRRIITALGNGYSVDDAAVATIGIAGSWIRSPSLSRRA